ncbi:MAG TPA: mechanosensitive ion channel family protein, partial [Marinobacter sp.]|nr:mechanosensitive ion channel family protein [Marinobacter sp.]
MAESIFGAVSEQIKQNLTDTLTAFGDGQADWGELAVHALSQLLISALYLGLFLVVYALLISIVRFAVGKKRAQHPLFNHARTGIR